MESALDWHTARALLDWQIELGATETIGEEPVDRYALTDRRPAMAKMDQPVGSKTPATRSSGRPAPAVVSQLQSAPDVDPVAIAVHAAQAASTLPALREAMVAFPHCDLRNGARNLVFCDGKAGARVMIIGDAPGRDEDREGKSFSGRAGQLLDKMLAAIDLNRSDNVYLTSVLPWRPPQNRDPRPAEIAMMTPFLKRHVELAEPEILIAMGDVSCQALLGKPGITRLRGKWDQVWGKAVIAMFPPDYLLRQPQMKREAWADLLTVRARLSS